VKAGGKERNRISEISDCIGKMKEMEDRKSVPIGSPLGQNEQPVPIGEPIGDKNRITSLALKRAGKHKEQAVSVWWAEN
jgi:hypothetical protein